MALIAVGILAPLAGLEIVLRVFGPVLPGDYQTATFASPSAVIGRQNTPNRAGWIHTGEFTTWVRINSQGLRGPEIPYQKPADTYRILVLGDSFTLAAQVAEEETFTARLEERLRQARPGRAFQAINAGTDGWSTVNEYVWLTREGYRYQPDLVVVMFYVGNDPNINAQQIGSPEQLDRRVELGTARTPLARARAALSERSMAYSYLEFGVLAKLSQHPPDLEDDPAPAADEGVDLDEWRQRSWAVSAAVLRRMKEFCDAHAIDLVVVGIPKDEQVRDPSLPGTPLSSIAQRLGLYAIDLLDPFRAQSEDVRRRGNLYFTKNLHWTPAGHALAAEIVAGDLVASGIVPGDVAASPTPTPTPRAVRAPWRTERPPLQTEGAGVTAVEFGPASRRLVAGTADGQLRLWRVANGELVWARTVGDTVLAASVSPDGETVATASGNRSVSLARLSDGRPLGTLEGHEDDVTSLAFSPDGATLVSGSEDESLRFWDVAARTIRRIKNPRAGPIYSLAYSPDRQTLASGSRDQVVRLWRTSDVRSLRELEAEHSPVRGLSFSHGGRLLACRAGDGIVRVWRVSDGKPLLTLRANRGQVRDIAFSPDGQILAAASTSGSVLLWNAADGSLVAELGRQSSPLSSVAFSPDGMLLAAGAEDGRVLLWSAE